MKINSLSIICHQPTALKAGARGARPRTAETDRWLYHECERDTVFRKDRPLAGLVPAREGQSKLICANFAHVSFSWLFHKVKRK